MDLKDIGWNSAFNFHFEQLGDSELEPARIVRQDRTQYVARAEAGEVPSEVSGRMRHTIRRPSDFPVVGDWVALRRNSTPGRIEAVLERKSAFSRQAAGGKTEEQVLVANLDALFLVSGLDGDYNLRRIERYVNLAWESGATPVLILNKVDLCRDLSGSIREVEGVASGCEIHCVGAMTGTGFDPLQRFLSPGRTVALLGSSGVGKSTIVNRLLGDSTQAVLPVREDDSRGRHTTVRRELFVLSSGGVIIDTPGLREVRLWGDGDTLRATFPEIEAVSVGCRFADCQHEVEPGCGVLAALEQGELDSARYESYRKMGKELEHAARQREPHKSRARDRRFSKMVRNASQTKYKNRER